MLSRKTLACLALCVVIAPMLRAMNVSNLGNVVFEPEFHMDKRFEFAALAERGTHVHAFDECGFAENVLRIYNCDQDALAMLKGFSPTSSVGELDILLNADDDGVRGHFKVDGKLDLLFNTTYGFRWHFANDFIFSLFLPVMGMRLHDVDWHNLTLDVTAQDVRVRELLTDNFFANVERLGSLNLQGWRREGLGDLTGYVEWWHDFPQPKPLLKNIRLNARLGLSAPTGHTKNEDLLFAVPFGNDGAWGLIGEGGLKAQLGRYVRLGFDVALTHLFGNSKLRRIKTDFDQTELLLLQKVCAFKDWGLLQQFTLYFEFYQVYRGLSFRAYYQFNKKGDDKLAIDTQDFSNIIANSSRSLEEWTSHYAILMADYDFGYDPTRDARIKPRLTFYSRVPFNGKNVALFTSVGATLAVDF